MSRWRWDKKTTVEECRSLGVSDLRRMGAFKVGGSSSHLPISWRTSDGAVTGDISLYIERMCGAVQAVRFWYTAGPPGGQKQTFDYRAGITVTFPHLGGARYWFLCPVSRNGQPCGRRVGKLYLPPGQTVFGCRRCHDLTYQSVQEHDKRVDRLAKLPPEALSKMATSGNVSDTILLLKAWDKFRSKL